MRVRSRVSEWDHTSLYIRQNQKLVIVRVRGFMRVMVGVGVEVRVKVSEGGHTCLDS